MQTTHLGRTGLKVSRICLGTMTYGSPAWRDWVLDEAASRPGDAAGMLDAGEPSLHGTPRQAGEPGSCPASDPPSINLDTVETRTDLDGDDAQAFVGEKEIGGGSDHHMR